MVTYPDETLIYTPDTDFVVVVLDGDRVHTFGYLSLHEGESRIDYDPNWRSKSHRRVRELLFDWGDKYGPVQILEPDTPAHDALWARMVAVIMSEGMVTKE